MVLTEFQRQLCRLIAQQRIASGERDAAGGVALNALTDAARVSHDIDLFHDSAKAVLNSRGELVTGWPGQGESHFHERRIRGVWSPPK